MLYYCHAGVAQSVVHLIRNQKVAGSSPAASSKEEPLCAAEFCAAKRQPERLQLEPLGSLSSL